MTVAVAAAAAVVVDSMGAIMYPAVEV